MIKDYFKKLFYLLGSEKRKLPIIFLSFLSLSLLDIIGLGLIGPFMNITLNNHLDPRIVNLFEWVGLKSDRNFILSFSSITIIIIFLLKAILIIAINWYIIRYSQYQRVRLSNELLMMYQNISFLKFLNKNTSSYIYTVHTLTSNYVNVVKSSLKLLSDLLVSLAIISVLFYTNIQLLVTLICVFGSLAYINDLVFREKMKNYGIEANFLGTKLFQNINESLLGIKEMRILGYMKFFRSRAIENCDSMNKINEKRQVIMLLPKQVTEFVLVAILIIFIFYNLNSSTLNELIPILTIFGFGALRLLPIINSISLGVLNFRHDHDILKRLCDDYDYIKQNSQNYTETSNIYKNDFEDINLKNIKFSYDNKILLKDISLKINKNEMIGITGPSGSGKSTLVDIMLGLIEPDHGDIFINNKKTSTKSIKDFQKQVSYIPQDIFLIDGSLKENIAIGIDKEEIDLKKIDSAIKLSDLDGFIKNLPDNIDTLVGEKGSKISGGQKQRISLARSLYHERKFIVMDEGTSALDNKTEKIVVNSLNKLKSSHTILMISHRMSSLKYCDKIFNIQDGNLTMFKNFNDLLNHQAK